MISAGGTVQQSNQRAATNARQLESSNLLEDAESALKKLTHQEICLVKETEEMFKRQVDHMRLIDRLQSYIPNMEKIDVHTKKLSSLVDSSSLLVEDVCSRVKRIDSAKARLNDCLAKIGDILDLKTCRNGVLKAMEAHNYEEAAMHIKRFLSINQDELRKTTSIICGDEEQSGRISHLLVNMNIPGEQPKSETHQDNYDDGTTIDLKFMNSALAELAETRERLLQLCQENMARSIKENDTKDIERYFKIFPMLDEHQDGLHRYANYLQSKIVDEQLDNIFKSKQTNQADKLAALYERIAKLIDLHQPLIETYYGPGHLIPIIRVIQKECDRLSRKVLEEFRNETKLQNVARLVKSCSLQAPGNYQSALASGPNTGPSLNPSKLDPRDIDNILNEISLIVSRSEVYLSFIVQRVKDDIGLKFDDEAQRKSSLFELYDLVCETCELNHLIQEVGGIYVMLEQFYLNESSKKAILMDQIDVESSSCFVSSMLDDIFFIIKKCTKRAISTKSNEVFCAIINHCVTLLESTFCQVLTDKLKNQQYYSTSFTARNLDLSQAYSVIQSSRYLQSSSELEVAKAQYFSALNNLDKACDYIRTLRGILDIDIKRLRPSLLVVEQQRDNQIEKSATCLNELSQLINRFGSIVNSSLYQLFNSSLRNRLKMKLGVILSENPELNSIVANNPEEISSLAKDLLTTLDKSLQENLTVENYTKLVSITKDFLASSMKN